MQHFSKHHDHPNPTKQAYPHHDQSSSHLAHEPVVHLQSSRLQQVSFLQYFSTRISSSRVRHVSHIQHSHLQQQIVTLLIIVSIRISGSSVTLFNPISHSYLPLASLAQVLTLIVMFSTCIYSSCFNSVLIIFSSHISSCSFNPISIFITCISSEQFNSVSHI